MVTTTTANSSLSSKTKMTSTIQEISAPEDISLAADVDATQGTQDPEPSQRNPDSKCLTQVGPQDKGAPEIHFQVPIGNANKNLKLPNSITFSLFRGSVADVMGLTVDSASP